MLISFKEIMEFINQQSKYVSLKNGVSYDTDRKRLYWKEETLCGKEKLYSYYWEPKNSLLTLYGSSITVPYPKYKEL